MKKVFIVPEMNISYFKTENIVTLSGVKYDKGLENFKREHTTASLSWNELVELH